MATTTKPTIVEYEVYFEWGEKAVFRAAKGSIFVFNGEWIAIPQAPFAANKPVYVPKSKIRYIQVNPA